MWCILATRVLCNDTTTIYNVRECMYIYIYKCILYLLAHIYNEQDPIQYQDKFLNRYSICGKRARPMMKEEEEEEEARSSASNHNNHHHNNNRDRDRDRGNNVMWVSTHVRPFRGWHRSEVTDVILHFNHQMKSFFASHQCGDVQYVDVTNMTHMLQLPDLRGNLWKKLTYDGMHFSRTVNVLKAHIILNQLV
jgi:hypothetical protein